nr:retrovirus-related Pol polyprotein from transposon TNT 1-94 [Tanacetum cinerariifolium]
CSACEQGKIHRKHHKFKMAFASNKPLYLLHIDLYGPMRIESINKKRYVLVVVDDYSWYTWVFFLHSKDEASEVIISFIKKTQVNLQLQVQHVRTNNGMEFKNKTLVKFFDEVGISQQFFAARTPQQNGVVERRNRTLVEAARTMLTFSNLPLFLWAKAIATACFTQNRSIIYKRFDKTPYELMNKRKPNIKFFCVFRCRCYLLNDYEDVGKLKAKEDIGVFVGYSKESVAFRIYNKRTRKIHESVNVNFDEISEMASKQFNLESGLFNLNETEKSSNPSVLQVSETSKKDLEDLFQNFYDEYFDSSKIMKSSTINVETFNVEIPLNEEEDFHEMNLQLQVQHVRTDNGTEFKNKTLAKFFDEVGITQPFSAARTPQQNGVVERRNRTFVEAARTMLTFANLPSCRCYLLNNYEDVGKLKAKWDIEVFVGYSKESAAFRIYNKRTHKIHESVNVNFDELSEIASKQFSLGPSLSNLNEMGKSSNLSVSQVDETSKKDLEDLFQDFYDNPEEVILPQTNTQSIPINMIPNGDEASTSHNVFNERLKDAYFDASTSFHDPSNVHTYYHPYPHEKKWTKDHPLHKTIGDPKSSVRTRGQLANSSLFSCLLSSIEPAIVAEALRDADWVSAMQ